MRFKNLNRYRTGGVGSKMELAIPLPKTPDGRVYRFSPNEEAHPRHFVIGPVAAEIEMSEASRARMRLEPHSKQTVCPYSGVIAADGDFNHPDDVKAAIETVKHAAIADVHDEFAKMFRGLGSRNSAIRVETKQATPRPKPRFARRDLMRELVCDHCGRDYGVFAIGLFCPDCGAPNLRLHFAREVELIGAQVSLAEQLEDGQEELAYRLLGNAHEDVLTAVEATLKTVYLYGMAQRPAEAPPFKPVKNDFQNIDRATGRYAELGLNPFEPLSDAELEALRLNIEKRHVIGHNLGVVDGKFAAQAVDAKLGETVHLAGEDIRQFAAISQRVVDRLDAWLGGSASPTIGTSEPVMVSISAPAQADDPKGLMKLDLEMSRLAREVGLWAAEQCSDGMRQFLDTEQLVAAFPEAGKRVLEEAFAELEAEGMIQISRDLGRGLPSARPNVELYATFDPIAHGHDPIADAAHLAELSLAGDDSVSSPELIEKAGWERRRFNPALSVLIAQVDERRVSRTLDPEFPARSFFLLAEDRIALKRFIARTKG